MAQACAEARADHMDVSPLHMEIRRQAVAASMAKTVGYSLCVPG
jgi:hypothetical protein